MDINIFDENYFMRRALEQARNAFADGEVPVGAVAVHKGRIIASAYNQVEKLKDATAHAEMILITQAAAAVGGWRLDEVDIYVTKEPCPMCAGAMLNSRVRRLFFGMADPKFGAAGSAVNLFSMPCAPCKIRIAGSILEEEAKAIMQEFFRMLRVKNK